MVWSGNVFFGVSARLEQGTGSGAIILVCALALLFPTRGWSEENLQNTITVDQPPPGPSTSAGPRASAGSANPDEIKGIRIQSNGALITGPIGARKVYIRLDSAVVPPRFQALWVGDQTLCASAREAGRSNSEKLPDGTILLTDGQMFGRQTYDIQQVFVPLPSTFTLDMLNSGKQLVLPASDYRSTLEALVIFSRRDKGRDYMGLSLSDQEQKLNLWGKNGKETGSRCDPQ
ncbi:hypothetical protein NIBR502774_14330 (plasmid) [Rhizobium sp. NIBRBAC000502774]|nr:hypothetical protein NIBR502774_14330 [Rhizobium sp. NIBRBAC000502774]